MPIIFDDKKLYSVKELAEVLPITPLTIREYLKKGKIRGHKIGKNWYVPKKDLERFLEGNLPTLKKSLGRFMKKTLKNLTNIRGNIA